jgi:transcriptional regulator with XRE-family HTH domain
MASVTSLDTPTRTSPRTANRRRTRKVVSTVLEDIGRLCADAGISLRRLAAAADIDPGYLSQIMSGRRQPSVPVLVALTSALGADLSIRAYPTTGPVLRDRLQAPIAEELLRIADGSWRRSVEVAVYRPARGYIDVVLDRRRTFVAGEVQSRLDRLEQTLRWAGAKASSLPSSELCRDVEGDPVIHRLLVLRSTSATRELARVFHDTLQAAYPAATADVFAALTTPNTPWPGHGILWADLRGDRVRILDRPPRGVDLGR